TPNHESLITTHKTMNIKNSLAKCLCFSIILAAGSCKTPHVQRMSETAVTDLSGRWNETDSRITAEEISAELASHSWYNTFSSTNQGKKPVIIVGMITNKSHEHIPTETFSLDIEKS